jgi:putative drug exporter of the RND superfamily
MKREFFALPAGRLAKWITMGLWLVALAVAVPLAAGMGSVQSDKETDRLPGDAESTRVVEIADRIPGAEADQVLIVYKRPGGLTDEDRAAAQRHQQTLSAEFGSDMPAVPAKDGSALLFSVSRAGPDEEVSEKATTKFVEHVRQVVADRPTGLTAQVTGPSAIGADIDAVFEGIDTTLMLVTVAVVAILLIFTYRSPFLWLVPLLSVGGAALTSMAAVYLVAKAFGVTVSTQSFSIMIVMVFGAGTDYALLLVARYREELHRNVDVHDAMRAALRGVGPAILASGGTVTVGLLCMLFAQMNDISGIGLIGAIGVACTLLTMLTLFPAVLMALGRKVFWPRVPRFGGAGERRGLWWVRAGRAFLDHPTRTAAISAAVLGALGVGVFGLSTGLTRADSFTKTPESVAGYATLGQAYPGQGGRSLTVAARTDHQEQVVAAAEAVPGMARVEVDREAGGWTLIEAMPGAAPDSQEEADTVLRLRSELSKVDGAQAIVGGDAAERLDVRNAAGADTRLVIPLVLLVVLLVLGLLLRALAASLVVVGAVVLSFVAALGLGTLIFDGLLGFGGSEPTLPAMAFVFLIAFGVDYAIFLVARIADDARTDGTVTATRRALTATGPVIASAGVVLAATFGVLASLPFVPMVELGLVVAVGVLLQTLIVAPALVAPLIVGLRRWIWWPGRGAAAAKEPEPVGVGERV